MLSSTKKRMMGLVFFMGSLRQGEARLQGPSLGKELADKNIAVNAVTPAGAKTRILDQMTKDHVQRMLSKVPRGRFLEVEEFTSLVCWLSSEEEALEWSPPVPRILGQAQGPGSRRGLLPLLCYLCFYFFRQTR